MYKKRGDKKWLTCKTDNYSRNLYFNNRKDAANYAKHLTSFRTKVVNTKR